MLQFLRSHRWRRLWWPMLALLVYAQGTALVHAVEHGLQQEPFPGQSAYEHGLHPGESAGGDHDHLDDEWGHAAGSADCRLFDQVASVLGCAADAPDIAQAPASCPPRQGAGAHTAAAGIREPYQARAPPAA